MIGFGYDIHRLASGESLVIGGVSIPSDFGTVAHSDGDFLLHALCDALLGAAGLGDIGEYFPDTDPQYKNADSKIFVKKVMEIIKQKKLRIINIDATIVLEKPKILNYKPKMKEIISSLCELPLEKVAIKATTNEMVGFIGREKALHHFVFASLKSVKQKT